MKCMHPKARAVGRSENPGEGGSNSNQMDLLQEKVLEIFLKKIRVRIVPPRYRTLFQYKPDPRPSL